MQRATTVDSGPEPSTFTAEDADPTASVECPVCGEPVRGIAAAKPGEHRFVGCDHYASARFLRDQATSADASVGRPALGP